MLTWSGARLPSTWRFAARCWSDAGACPNRSSEIYESVFGWVALCDAVETDFYVSRWCVPEARNQGAQCDNTKASVEVGG